MGYSFLVLFFFTPFTRYFHPQIPWALRDLIANPDVAGLFASEFSSLRSAFDDWHPRTSILRDIRRKLEPIRRLNVTKL